MSQWKVLSSKYTYRDRWVRLRTDTLQSPQGRILEAYHTLETADWVNIIAITSEKGIVLVEQYRPSIKSTQTELPGGLVDHGEDPETAARRELLEETGFSGGRWLNLGALTAMGARISGEFHSFLAIGVSRTQCQRLEAHEDIEVREMPWNQFRRDLPLREGNQVASLMMLQIYASTCGDPELQQFQPCPA